MIKKLFLGVGSFILACVIIFMIPISSIIKDETASDAVLIVSSILLALTIYRFLKSKLIN